MIHLSPDVSTITSKQPECTHDQNHSSSDQSEQIAVGAHIVQSSEILPIIQPLTSSTTSSSTSAHTMATRLQQGIVKPNPKYFLATISVPTEPKSVKSVLKHPGWVAAIQEEHSALHQKDTWDLVPRPPNVNLIGSKWVFKTKLKADGSLERLKARLVAKGYTQIPGIDFIEDFSPVIKPTTIRVSTS